MNDHADRLNHVTATITDPQFRDIVELARRSELPLEAVLSIYRDPSSNQPSGRPPVPSELDMGTDKKTLPGQSCQLTVTRKLEWGAFAASHLEIDGNPADWMIEHFKIGSREQLHRGSNMKLVPVRGSYFNDCIRGRVEVAGPGMDVMICVTYLGTNPEGEAFKAVLYGTAT